MRALDASLAAGIRAGAGFRAITPRGGILEPAISDRTVGRIVERTALAAGLDPRKRAGHSLRAGFVVEVHVCDVAEVEVMEQSGQADLRTAQGYRRASTLLERDIT